MIMNNAVYVLIRAGNPHLVEHIENAINITHEESTKC